MTEEQRNADLISSMAHKISSDIFKNGLLLSYSIGFWDGKIKQGNEDMEIQHANSAPEVYGRGTKLLLPYGSLKEFYGCRSRLGAFLTRTSFPVPGLRGSRFIPKAIYAQVKEYIEKESEFFYKSVEEFLVKYPTYKMSQIRVFNEKYPASAGSLDLLYPSEDVIRARFYYSWMPYAWDYASIIEVEREAKDILADRALGMVNEACISMRKEMYQELLGAINVVKSAKHKVNIRTVSNLQEKINSLKTLNIFGDKSLEDLLTRSSDLMDSVSSWKTDDLGKTDFDVQLGSLLKDVSASIVAAVDNPIDEISVYRNTIDDLNNEANISATENLTVTRNKKVVM